MESRTKILNRIILAITVSMAILIQRNGFSITRFSPWVDLLLAIFAPLISYSLISNFTFSFLNKSTTFQKIIWGRNYLQGFWTYTSIDDEGNRFLGVWRIDQDTDGASVIAFGLDNNTLFKRTRVRSIGHIYEFNRLLEVINERVDWEFSKIASYSKTTMSADMPERDGLFKYPFIMRGETWIYGGPRDGTVTKNVIFKKYVGVKSEAALIKKIADEKGIKLE